MNVDLLNFQSKEPRSLLSQPAFQCFNGQGKWWLNTLHASPRTLRRCAESASGRESTPAVREQANEIREPLRAYACSRCQTMHQEESGMEE